MSGFSNYYGNEIYLDHDVIENCVKKTLEDLLNNLPEEYHRYSVIDAMLDEMKIELKNAYVAICP